MLTENEKQGWRELDSKAQLAGGYVTAPKRPLVIEYDYRAMTSYCKKKGVSKMDLTESELSMFEYAEPFIYS
ncbi:MAG: hypothetical protein FWB75_07575 [Oscillospiraceae bacterium]|nr:hypothetical protein [Oscillospiraceae bacterium]